MAVNDLGKETDFEDGAFFLVNETIFEAGATFFESEMFFGRNVDAECCFED